MSATLHDIAKKAGVSIATVSHVINRTRYVSPELKQKVFNAIDETGYQIKASSQTSRMRRGRESEIALLTPNVSSTVYAQLTTLLSARFEEEGFSVAIYNTLDNEKREKEIIHTILTKRQTAGIILIPNKESKSEYTQLIESDIPFIFLERSLKDIDVCSVLSENRQAIYNGTSHLIKNGHERITLLLENKELTTVDERLEGYKEALEKYSVCFRNDLILLVDLYNSENYSFQSTLHVFEEYYKRVQPTAIIAAGNTLTMDLLKNLNELGLDIPKDVSVIGFGDDEWCPLINPPLTTLRHDTDAMAEATANTLLEMIVEHRTKQKLFRVPMNLTVRESTQVIGRGPFGERVVSPDFIMLSEEEKEELRQGDFKVGVSFHYSGDIWTTLHEQAIKDTFNLLGIKLLSVTDAHLDPDLQNTQLEGLIMQNPDAIISVPSDEEKTAKKYMEISKKTKLILINNMPVGFTQADYECWISVNERENGQNAGRILKDYFSSYKKPVKIGLLTHGTPFFATSQRDFAAQQVLQESNTIEIVSKKDFITIENTYNVCRDMLDEHPDINGLYISWERPALEAIRLLKERNRDDIVISTTDLDKSIAKYMAENKMVIGLSSQQPYEQGVAVTNATAKALLGKTKYKAIGVQPRIVLPRNLKKAWREITKTALPLPLTSDTSEL